MPLRLVASVWFLVLLGAVMATGCFRAGAAGPYRIHLPSVPRIGGVAVAALVSVVADRPAPQPVGTSVTWRAISSGTGQWEYRFSLSEDGGPPSLVRDFGPAPSFTWTPIDEGSYRLIVDVRDAQTGAPSGGAQSDSYPITPRAAAGAPVVAATAHPLVALYSTPPCGSGTVRVLFAAGADAQGGSSTPSQPCSAVRGNAAYVVGMRPSTTYTLRAEVTRDGSTVLGPASTFTTGALPDGIGLPAVSAPLARQPGASSEPIVYHDDFVGGNGTVFATDLSGAVVWYLRDQGHPVLVAQPLPGGDVLVLLGPLDAPIIRVVDPAGNTVRETSHAALSHQIAGLAARGAQPYRFLHHDARLLPNGHIVVLAAVDRLFPPGTHGWTGDGAVDVMTDEIVDLDQDLQIDWVWNAFDHLDAARPSVLGEQAQEAWGLVDDWTHSNAVVYSPADHSLLLSVRHLDQILNINYADGAGDGRVLWRLGNGGDFALVNPPIDDPFPWFSHQHGIALSTDGRLATFDNGNTRCASADPVCDSRGQVYLLDEAGRTAQLLVDADLGGYSFALGWAQVLGNGDYAFTPGWQLDGDGAFGQGIELDPTGAAALYTVQDRALVYRTMRLASMYSGCCDASSVQAAGRRGLLRAVLPTHPVRPGRAPSRPLRGATPAIPGLHLP